MFLFCKEDMSILDGERLMFRQIPHVVMMTHAAPEIVIMYGWAAFLFTLRRC